MAIPSDCPYYPYREIKIGVRLRRCQDCFPSKVLKVFKRSANSVRYPDISRPSQHYFSSGSEVRGIWLTESLGYLEFLHLNITIPSGRLPARLARMLLSATILGRFCRLRDRSWMGSGAREVCRRSGMGMLLGGLLLGLVRYFSC